MYYKTNLQTLAKIEFKYKSGLIALTVKEGTCKKKLLSTEGSILRGLNVYWLKSTFKAKQVENIIHQALSSPKRYSLVTQEMEKKLFLKLKLPSFSQ